ncbi:MAG: SH3 domain-containing protein [Eisenbergiella sp.]
MIKDKKLMKFISGLGTTACCLLAAGFLFAAAPMTAHAVPLGSNPGGASTNTDEGAAGDDAEAGGAEDTGDTGNEGAGEAAGGSVTSATVTSGSVNVRSEASTGASVAGKATPADMELTVTGETQSSDGKTWYAIAEATALP